MPADDVLDLLRRHDPAGGAPPPSDEVLAEARRRAAQPSRPRRARGRIALALTLAAGALAVALLAGLPSGSAPPDAAAALRAAADRTASVESGRLVWEVDERSTDPVLEHHVRSVLRWDGEDFHSRASYDGTLDEHVLVGGRQFERRDGEDWRPVAGTGAAVVREQVRARVVDEGLLDVLRAARSVERTERDAGGERFTGTLSQAQLAELGSEGAAAYLLARRGLAQPSPARVRVTTDGAGRIAEVVLEQRRGPLVTRVRTAFEALGEPQGIEAP